MPHSEELEIDDKKDIFDVAPLLLENFPKEACVSYAHLYLF